MDYQVSESQLSAMEMAKRELARRRLVNFMPFVDKRFDPMPPHVPIICKELEEVVRFIETGEGTELLIITIPPRHLKTTTVGQLLPAYFLVRNPDKKVILTTYAANLAFDSSRVVRGIIGQSEEYDSLFGTKATSLVDEDGKPLPPVDLRRDSRAVDRWQIDTYGGAFYAVGFDGLVTGRGGHLIIVDDPHANRKQAESPLEQKNVWDYFISTLYTRREKNAGIVIIMQLWNENDLVGRIKRVTNPDDPEYIPNFPKPKILNLPAVAEKNDPMGRREGESLWPGFMDERQLITTKAVLGDYNFNSQYQQRPTAPEGNIFKRPWFTVVPKAPITYKIQYWDTAEKDGQENDYWAGGTFGITRYGILVTDVVKRKMEAAEGEEEIIRFYNEHNSEDEPVSVVWIEAKASGSAIVSSIRAGESNVPVDEDVPKMDKIARANSVQTQFKNRRVQLLQHSKWIQTLIEDMTSFPFGPHDDVVDMMVGGVMKLVNAGHVKQQNAQRIVDKSMGLTGAEKREKLFGKDGKGIRRGRGAMRLPPTLK